MKISVVLDYEAVGDVELAVTSLREAYHFYETIGGGRPEYLVKCVNDSPRIVVGDTNKP